MFDKLSGIEERFKELETKISDPAVIADRDAWRDACKEDEQSFRPYQDY